MPTYTRRALLGSGLAVARTLFHGQEATAQEPSDFVLDHAGREMVRLHNRGHLRRGTGAPTALTNLVPRHYTPGLVAPLKKSLVVMLALVLSVQTLLPVIASAQEQMPAASPGQAVAKGLRLMRAKGWTPTNAPVIKQVLSPSVRRVDNGAMTDGAVTISWQSWDDGNPVTWEGVVTLAGPTGDIQSYVQQINLTNGDPVVTYQVCSTRRRRLCVTAAFRRTSARRVRLRAQPCRA